MCGPQRECVTRFSTSIFSLFQSIWAPDKRAKVFSNLVSISQRQSPQCATHGGVKDIKFRKKTPRCATYRGDYLRAHCRDDLSGVQHTAATISQNTAESRAPSFKKISAVCITLKRCNKPHVRDDPSNVQHTVEMIFKVCNTPYCFKKFDVFRS